MRSFTKEQLVFVVDAILIGALNRIEVNLPSEIQFARTDLVEDIQTLSHGEEAVLQAAGMALAVLDYRLTGDACGVEDALVCAGDFRDKCETLMRIAWENGGTKYKGSDEALSKLYSPFYPDTKVCAEDFVEQRMLTFFQEH